MKMRKSQEPECFCFWQIWTESSVHGHIANLCRLRWPPSTVTENREKNMKITYCQGYHGQGKISGKRNFFQVREKSGNFVDGQGNLGRTWKVREKSENFENKWLWQEVFRNVFILFKKGKGVL